MKILFLLPPVIYRRQPSIGIAYLLSVLRNKGFETDAWDLNTAITGINDGDDGYWGQDKVAEKFIRDNSSIFNKWVERICEYSPDIIGFNVWQTNRKQSIFIAERVKEKMPGVLILFGGPEAVLGDNVFWDEMAVDILIKGEGEETILDIIDQFSSKGLIQNCPGCSVRQRNGLIDCGKRGEIQDLDKLPFPDFSDFDMKDYLFEGHIPISFGRGCIWRCGFCTVENCWDSFRTRTANNIFKEIKLRLKEHDVKQFVNCDPALNQDLSMLEELCDLIIKDNMDIKWDGMAQIRMDMDMHLLKKMNKAGCVLLNFGIESGSDTVLKLMGKRYNSNDAKTVIKNTSEAGINVVLNFVVGYPGETDEFFNETLDFVRSIKGYVLNIAHAHPCLVVPYNKLFRYPDKYGITYDIQDTYHWKSNDGKNTSFIREKRAEVFEKLLNDLEVDARCGQDDRRVMGEGKSWNVNK